MGEIIHADFVNRRKLKVAPEPMEPANSICLFDTIEILEGDGRELAPRRRGMDSIWALMDTMEGTWKDRKLTYACGIRSCEATCVVDFTDNTPALDDDIWYKMHADCRRQKVRGSS